MRNSSRTFGGSADVTLRDRVNALRTEALEAAERGWPVLPLWSVAPDPRGDPFPALRRWLGYDSPPPGFRCTCLDWGLCEAPGKHPVSSLAPHGFRSGTLDQDTIRRWWTKPYNIGISVGGAELGIIDLDDPAAQKAWDDGPYGKYDTRRVSTGRGQHLYFRIDPGAWLLPTIPQKAIQAHSERTGWLLPKTDFLCQDRLVVFPGSQHRSGRFYEWVNPKTPIQVMPEELYAWLAEAAGPAAVERAKARFSLRAAVSRSRRFGGVVSTGATGARRTADNGYEPIRSFKGYTNYHLDLLVNAEDGWRNNMCTRVSLALADVFEQSEGQIPLHQLRWWYLGAALENGVLREETFKTWDVWCRMTGDTVTLREILHFTATGEVSE